jgi:ferritin-like protein
MTSETLHAPRARLTVHTLTKHQAIVSLMEELEASDWYRQRADDCEDEALKAILLHNMREEIEHACMLIEWLRRSDAEWAEQLSTYLFTEAPITEVEEMEEAKDDGSAGEAGARGDGPRARTAGRFTIGKLKD